MNIGATGKSGEDRVATFLRKNGWSVIKRNYQCRFGEIDIIADNDEYIIFVDADDVMEVNERFIQRVFKEIKGIDISGFLWYNLSCL